MRLRADGFEAAVNHVPAPEIRFDGGRYTLVDLESQNGIWVSGTRVPSVVLGPDVIAAVGPFRLTVKDVAPLAEPAPDRTQITPAPIVTPLPNVTPAPNVQPMPDVTPAPLNLDALGPVHKEPAPRPPTPKPPPVAKPAPRPQQGRQWYEDTRVWMWSAAAVLLIAGSAFVGFKVIKGNRAPILDEAVTARLIAEGKCGEAMATQINPVLAADPNNQKARQFRDQCAAPPPPPPTVLTTSVPVPPPVTERLDEAQKSIDAKDCAKALEIINPVLLEDPNNERAKDLFAKATACGNPIVTPPPTTGDKPAVAVSPAQGGLEVLPSETEKSYRARMMSLRKKYDDAVALLQIQKYQQARKAFDEIASQVPGGYIELAKRRGEAQNGVHAEATSFLEAAQAAEKADDLENASNLYRRAHDLDPTIQVDAQMQRVNERRITVGRDRCEKGLLEYKFGNTAGAKSLLQEAVKFLPANDPCYAKAKEKLQEIAK